MLRRKGRTTGLALSLLVCGGLTSACAGSSPPPVESSAPETIEQAPDWYQNPEAYGDSAHLVSTATAVSSRMQLAVDKAKTAARATLSERLGTRYEVFRKRLQEETRVDADADIMQRYEGMTRSVTDQVLLGTRAREREIHPTDSAAYRAYVLMELPLREADRLLLDEIMSDEEMYVRFRATKAFEDLRRAAEGKSSSLRNQ